LTNIEKQVESGSALTKQLLGFARDGKYEVRPIDLNRFLRETSETFSRTKREIATHFQLADDLLPIEADRTQIEQVIWNLCLNAADAMPAGGDLVFTTMNQTHEDMKGKLYEPKPGNYVFLKVSDTGMGMDQKTMDRIFDPFFTTKELGRGTGLGLASVYGIVKGHGGYIDVESEEGRGTNFCIHLPASEKRLPRSAPLPRELRPGTGTILLADDEEMILDTGTKILERLGYHVLEARSGSDAVHVYQENREKIDMVILDMIMPGMGGGEAYDRMKAIDPDIKVLLSSGYSIEGQAEEILNRGCQGFIQKPFKVFDLSNKIKELLAVPSAEQD
jgi:CheY-like chemotaxis protein